MSQPWTFDSSMRVHQQAIATWLDGLLIDYTDTGILEKPSIPILAVTASPERAYADSVVDTLVARNLINAVDAEAMRDKAKADFSLLPWPLAIREFGIPTLTTEFSGVPKVLRKFYYNRETQNLEQHRWPATYRLPFSITFLCRKRYTLDYIMEWVMGKLGDVGLGEHECLLDVIHAEPWGTVKHAMRLEDMSDESVLEGADSRALRLRVGFNLRMWVTRAPVTTVPFVENMGRSWHQVDLETDHATDTKELSRFTPQQSCNLFQLDGLEQWVQEGNGQFERTPINQYRNSTVLTAVVQSALDKVIYLEAPTLLDDTGYGLVGYSFKYLADQPARFSHDCEDVVNDTRINVSQFDLPVTRQWENIHRFDIVQHHVHRVFIQGTGNANPQTSYMYDLDIRHIAPQTKTTPSSTTPNGGYTEYRFASLTKYQPYLVVGILSAGTSADIVEAFADAAEITPVRTETIDSTKNIGFVLLIQPTIDNLLIRTANTTSLDSIYVQPYYNAYQGTTG